MKFCKTMAALCAAVLLMGGAAVRDLIDGGGLVP